MNGDAIHNVHYADLAPRCPGSDSFAVAELFTSTRLRIVSFESVVFYVE